MDRRTFLSGAATAGGLALLGGGFWGRQAFARNQLQSELVRQSTPILNKKAPRELGLLPGRAQEKMRTYFHGICLNVPTFVDEVCAAPFAEKVAAAPRPEQQQALLLEVFMREVVTEHQVLGQVQSIAEEISTELDQNWAGCCEDMVDKWGLAIKDYPTTVTAQGLTERMMPIIRRGIRETQERARKAGTRLALADGVVEVGKSALLLLPLSATAPWVGWPLFVVSVFQPVFHFFLDNLRHRASAMQRTMTDRLATLGNDVAFEFKQEIRLRIKDLHAWQEKAVAAAARQQAEELIRFI